MPRCLRCGRAVGNGTKYCRPCRKELKKDVPEKKERFTMTDLMRIKNVQCKTCKYGWKMPTGESNYLCNYLEIKGYMRPCEPSPDCTVYEKR